MKQENIASRLTFHRAALDKLQAAYLALVDGGVKSYSIGGRSLTRFDLSNLLDEIRAEESAIDALEQLSAGKRPRKAFGVVPTDW